MNIEIANRFVDLRKRSGLSQEALAEKLGISRQAVSKWERAEASPDTENLISLAKIYKISLDELLSTAEASPPVRETANAISIGLTATCAADFDKHNNDTSRKARNGLHEHQPASRFPIALIAVFLYVAIGLFWNIWSPTWLIFLLIPISSSLAAAVRHKDWTLLSYPPLVVFIYLTLGFFYDAWHPGWILFLTIPLYYSLIHYFRQKNSPLI
jgi:transcriptional regulator with XRE-family HTH domain